MMHFIDFQCFDSDVLPVLRHRIREESNEYNRLIEWTPKLGFICKHPDLTLICAQFLSWPELVKAANTAKGRQVVLLGDKIPITLGLPMLSSGFSTQELIALIAPADLENRKRTSPRRPPNTYEPDYKCTMPIHA